VKWASPGDSNVVTADLETPVGVRRRIDIVERNRWQFSFPTDARPSARGAEWEVVIGRLELEPGRHFAATRRDIRAFIAESEAGRDVDALIEELLS
jgi:hypothetical protein